MTVLFADDQEDVRRLYATVLKRSGYEVEIFEDGATLLERLMANGLRVDAAVIDHHMPGITGLEVLRRLRDSDQYKTLPVIIFSSDDSPDLPLAVRGLGADFVPKNGNHRELVAAIQKHSPSVP